MVVGVRAHNCQRLVDNIKAFLEKCSGVNWIEVAEKASRLGKWEFENYAE